MTDEPIELTPDLAKKLFGPRDIEQEQQQPELGPRACRQTTSRRPSGPTPSLPPWSKTSAA